MAKLLRSAEVMLNTSAGGGNAPSTVVGFCVISAVTVVVTVAVIVADRGTFCPRLLLAVGAITTATAVMDEIGRVGETAVMALTSSTGSFVASARLAGCG